MDIITNPHVGRKAETSNIGCEQTVIDTYTNKKTKQELKEINLLPQPLQGFEKAKLALTEGIKAGAVQKLSEDLSDAYNNRNKLIPQAFQSLMIWLNQKPIDQSYEDYKHRHDPPGTTKISSTGLNDEQAWSKQHRHDNPLLKFAHFNPITQLVDSSARALIPQEALTKTLSGAFRSYDDIKQVLINPSDKNFYKARATTAANIGPGTGELLEQTTANAAIALATDGLLKGAGALRRVTKVNAEELAARKIVEKEAENLKRQAVAQAKAPADNNIYVPGLNKEKVLEQTGTQQSVKSDLEHTKTQQSAKVDNNIDHHDFVPEPVIGKFWRQKMADGKEMMLIPIDHVQNSQWIQKFFNCDKEHPFYNNQAHLDKITEQGRTFYALTGPPKYIDQFETSLRSLLPDTKASQLHLDLMRETMQQLNSYETSIITPPSDSPLNLWRHKSDNGLQQMIIPVNKETEHIVQEMFANDKALHGAKHSLVHSKGQDLFEFTASLADGNNFEKTLASHPELGAKLKESQLTLEKKLELMKQEYRSKSTENKAASHKPSLAGQSR